MQSSMSVQSSAHRKARAQTSFPIWSARSRETGNVELMSLTARIIFVAERAIDGVAGSRESVSAVSGRRTLATSWTGVRKIFRSYHPSLGESGSCSHAVSQTTNGIATSETISPSYPQKPGRWSALGSGGCGVCVRSMGPETEARLAPCRASEEGDVADSGLHEWGSAGPKTSSDAHLESVKRGRFRRGRWRRFGHRSPPDDGVRCARKSGWPGVDPPTRAG